MVGSVSAQIGMLTFAVAIVAGVYAQNPHEVVLMRAMLAMIAAVFISQAVAWTTKMILRDYLQQRKVLIDRAHLAALPLETAEPVQEAATDTQDSE